MTTAKWGGRQRAEATRTRSQLSCKSGCAMWQLRVQQQRLTGVGESGNEGGRGRYLARPWQRLRVRPVRAHRHGATASIADFGSETVDAGATSWPNFISQHDLWPEQLCTVINRRQGAIWRQSENWTIGQSHAQAHTQRKRIRFTYDANLIALSLSLSRLTVALKVALTDAIAVG